jgi:topoisomerase-4 subunit A
LDGDEHIIGALVTDGVAKPNQNLIIATKNNMIKRTNIEDIISSRVNKISIMMKLQDNDEVINVIEDFTTAEENNNIVVVTNKGNAITYPINQISIVGKSASGVKNINTNEKIAAIALANKELLVVGTTSGYKVIYTNNISLGKRVGKPKQFLLLNSAEVINAFGILTNEQFVVLYNNNKIQYITVNEKMVNEIDGIFKAQRSNKIAKIYYLNNIN